jgi:hypothetical protein
MAAFDHDWKDDGSTYWPLIRLAGEKASGGKSFDTQKKNTASYLHYLLLARPDLHVTQGLLTCKSEVMFLLGTGGVGIGDVLSLGTTEAFTSSYMRSFIASTSLAPLQIHRIP